jgi:hypothetical protein
MADERPIVEPELGSRWAYYANREFPFVEELDTHLVTVLKIDNDRTRFQFWVEDDDGNGSWADRNELHHIQNGG